VLNTLASPALRSQTRLLERAAADGRADAAAIRDSYHGASYHVVRLALLGAAAFTDLLRYTVGDLVPTERVSRHRTSFLVKVRYYSAGGFAHREVYAERCA